MASQFNYEPFDGSRYVASIADMMARKNDPQARAAEIAGQANARATEIGGQAWGRAIENAGQLPMQMVEANRRKEAAQQQRTLGQQQIKANDLALGDQAQAKQVKVATMLGTLARGAGDEHEFGAQLQTMQDMGLVPPEAMTHFQNDLQTAGGWKPLQQRYVAIAQRLTPQATKTRQIEVQNADGSKSIQIVPDQPGQTFASAAPPKPEPAPQRIETVDEQGKPVQRFVSPIAGATFPVVPPVVKPEAEPALGSSADYIKRYAKDNGLDPATMTAAQTAAALQKYRDSTTKTPVLGGMDALYRETDPKAIADAIIRGDRDPDTGRLGRPIGAAVETELSKRRYNQAQAITDWKATQKHVATLNGPQQTRLNQSINALPELLDSVDALASQWKGGRFPVLNKANLAAAKNGVFGDEVASVARKLDQQVADVTADLGQVYMGGNSPTDHALKLASTALAGDWSEKVLHDMVTLARSNVVIRRNSIQSTGVQGASGSNPYAPPNPMSSHDPTPQTPTLRFNPATGKLEKIVG